MDTLFFWLSKIAFALLSPDSLLVILALLTLACSLLGRPRMARVGASSCVIGLLLFGFLPIGEWLAAPLESRYESAPTLPQSLDGIVVLGGVVAAGHSERWGMSEVNAAAERLNAFMRLGRIYPEARLLYTGGSGDPLNPDLKEADAVFKLLADLGYDTQRIIFERESRNTYENAVHAKRLLNPQPGEAWLLITSAYHMPRSIGVFCQQRWPVIPYPVDHQGRPGVGLRLNFNLANNLSLLRLATKEWIGLLAYRLTGRTNELLPGREPGCASS
ncbi:MAG: membrane protein [Pseudohongiella sp.]|nr:MAG: membrane protein [Pseudohongiella sp.]